MPNSCEGIGVGAQEKRIAVLSASISRAAGGLFWSVRGLCNGIVENGWEVKVFGGHDIYSERDKLIWGNTQVRLFPTRGPRAFGYQSGLVAALKEYRPNLVHVHGLWMYPSVAVLRSRLHTVPRVISPRGMLDAWAVQNSRWKKRLAGLLYEHRHLRSATCLHALCDAEAAAFRDYGLHNAIAVIPNGVELPRLPHKPIEPEWALGLPSSARVLLFIGRLHPKKGLAGLLQAWARERPAGAGAQWHLVIAGWDQNRHEGELKGLVKSLGIGMTVHFVGPLFESEKLASLLRADAFVLPSFSEGLPMGVLEAWAHRLPVLMTSQCNLPEGFAAGAAVPMDPNVESISQALHTLSVMSGDELAEMGGRGRALVEERFTWSAVAAQMCSVYAWVLGQGPRPDCVRLD